MRRTNSSLKGHGRRIAGFTLVELLAAMAIFGVISAAAFGLMAQHQPLFNQQQIQASLNISMRNAIAQLQTDIVNGGSGYYSTANVPNYPVGVVITNNVVTSTGDCHSGITYGASCFDALTVIVSDPSTTPVAPIASTSGSIPSAANAGKCLANTTDTHANTTIYLTPPAGVTAATYSANFFNGDQILLVRSDGSTYTTVKLTHDGQTTVVGGTTYVLLTHSTVTNSDGTNAASDDVTGMSVSSSDQTSAHFCDTDWVLRLTPVQYDVDLSVASDPKLRRTVLVKGNTPSANGVTLAEQVIGFKVGAALVNGTTDTPTYNFDSSTFKISAGAAGYDYTMVRSVMISLVGRTPPVEDPTYVFRNSFDGGPYQIQGISVVVNPRNMSM
jgi:prepilin-type N-terminal cleavage/methylation domain-containing protein